MYKFRKVGESKQTGKHEQSHATNQPQSPLKRSSSRCSEPPPDQKEIKDELARRGAHRQHRPHRSFISEFLSLDLERLQLSCSSAQTMLQPPFCSLIFKLPVDPKLVACPSSLVAIPLHVMQDFAMTAKSTVDQSHIHLKDLDPLICFKAPNEMNTLQPSSLSLCAVHALR